MSEKLSLNALSVKMARSAMRRCRERQEGGKPERCALNLSSINKRFRICPFHDLCGKATLRGWITVIRFRLKKERKDNAES